ncbi:hypothetical protein K450DRAFT_256934 [Umbelopsis ramanniana AG]|uniref:BZIP domain-containing protein n=1 Tax=Umbelopsis ramanniana AG TaxID=1314678 RepID=A0AAD5HBS0_UMBRA|nr:uncharacterized protein K450DRAFT_256934 [Umbelopsis ramanniana AG]KAI8576483.1 hypothetical protein K450DRAFT_256934 [Umbelopsis ramanniana AG]
MSTLNQFNLLFEGDSPDHQLNENHSSDDSATVGDAQDSVPKNDDGVETYTKAQWKAMSPKERRQLRNKISARNFRTRRKEYMTTIEIELERTKQFATKLQQQVDVYKSQNEEIRAENSQLRLQVLLLSQQRSVTPPQQAPIQQQQPQAWPLTQNMLTVPNMQPQVYQRSTPPTSPPSTASEYEGTLPASSSPYQVDLLTDMNPINFNAYSMDQIYTFLSHTVVPNWNIEHVLNQSIPSQSAHDLYREYSLLAPALMSIIVRDTFVKNYQDFMKKSPLLLTAAPAATPVSITTSSKLGFSTRKSIENLSYKELKLIWDLLQSGLQQKDQAGIDQQQEEVQPREPCLSQLIAGARTWIWMKANVCDVVNSYVSVYAKRLKLSS